MILWKLANTLVLTAQQGASEGVEYVEHGESTESGKLHIPNILTFISESFAHHYEILFFALLMALMMVIAAFVLYRKRQMIPGPFQNLVEMLFEWLYDLVYAMLGEETDRYVPFIATLFMYIWFMNLMGLIPGLTSPTSAINATAALAITVFLYVQFIAMTRLGPLKYLHHLAGEPNSGVTWALVIINLPLHVVGEFVKPMSLALRLFGNILGEDILIAAMLMLGIMFLGIFGSPIGFPFQVPFYFLAMLTSTIQALVFAMLATSYIMMVVPHHEEH
jgi:F-type H+-transporting ATPase subunit a